MVWRPRMQRENIAYGWEPEARAYGRVSNVKNNADYDNYFDNDRAPEYADGYPENQNSDLSAVYDGDVLEVSNNGKTIGNYAAQSGSNGYRYKKAADIPDLGPIPEGEWLLKYSDFQTDTSPYNSDVHDHWGRERVRITPVNADTYGRDGFYLHGSYNGLGSAGCIDLGTQMPQFGGVMKQYQQDIPLTVKYNKERFKDNEPPYSPSTWEFIKNKLGF